MEDLGKTIREARGRKRISQEKLGELTGVSRSAVAQWELGQTTPDAERLPAIARALDIEAGELLGMVSANPSQSSHQDGEIAQFYRLQKGDKPLPPMVLFRTTPGERGRLEGFMLRAERVGEVERPEFLRFAGKAFAAKVLDDKNAPAYRRRDVILADPDSPPLEGEDCIFTADPNSQLGAFSVIGCLVKTTPTLWTIRQYATKSDRDLLRSEFPNAWLIVGRYNRR